MGKRLSKKYYYFPAAILFCSFSVIFFAYLFRNTLAIFAIEQYAKEQHIRVECLVFDINSNLDINVKKACIDLPDMEVLFNNVHFQRAQNRLTVGRINVTHKLAQSDSQPSPTEITSVDLSNWSLPSTLPLLRIDHLTVNSPLLARPLTLTINQPTNNSIQLEGDINGLLALHHQQGEQNARIIFDANWSLQNAVSYVKSDDPRLQSLTPLLTQKQLMDARIVSHIEFNGAQVTSRHQLSTGIDYSFDDCALHTKVRGSVGIAASLLTKELKIDLKAVDITASVGQSCYAPLANSSYTLASQFIVAAAEPIIINSESALIPSVNISSPVGFSASLTQLRIQFPTAEIPFATAGEIALNTHQGVALASNIVSEVQPAKTISLLSSQSNDSTLAITLAGRINTTGNDWSLHGLTGKFTGNKLTAYGLTARDSSVFINGDISSNKGLSLKLDVKGEALTYRLTDLADETSQSVKGKQANKVITVKGVESNILLSGETFNNLTFSAQNNLSQVKFDNVLVNKVANQLSGHILQQKQLALTGDSKLTGMALNLENSEYFTLAKINVSHTLETNLQTNTAHSRHDFEVENTLKFSLVQTQNIVTLTMAQQALSGLQPAISRFIPALVVQNGSLGLNGEYQVDKGIFTGNFILDNGALIYQEFNANGLSTEGQISFDSAGLQLDKTTLNIASAETGVPIEDIKMDYYIKDNVAKIEHITGKVLGGRFRLNELWLDKRDQQARITVTDLDLAQVVALQQQAGINVTGSVGGILPMFVRAGKFHIDGGRLKSQGPGTLKIDGNPAFDSIAAQQSELNFLKDLKFEQLSSEVKVDSDGLLLLDFSILGQNPNQQQAVNFNYHHEENILTLLRSLRLTDSVQNQIEKKIKKGGEK